jgi:murein DD-endopeptidase MepM/ murein hydrolase activator NlpD
MRLIEKEVLIIPKSKGNIRKFRFSKSIQLLILIIIVGLVGVIGSIGYDYISLKKQMTDYIALIEENQILKGENEKVSSDLLRIARKYEKVKLFEEELSSLIGINHEVQNSKGGPDFYSLYNDEHNTERLNEIRNGIINNLKRELAEKEDNFIKIKDFIYKNNSLIAATPSIWPVKGFISSGFKWRTNPLTGKKEFHKGIDIAGPIGTSVKSTADGIVTRAENNPYGYGNLIEIKHGFGFSTRYGHMNSYNVKLGQIVKRGQIIGTRGSTGRSTGPHLHYEVRISNKPVNPVNFILDYNLE